VSSRRLITELQADLDYYRDRAALLRAKRYRWGLGSNVRLEKLEASLERARRRLRDERSQTRG
jgi:hypothetical protein